MSNALDIRHDAPVRVRRRERSGVRLTRRGRLVVALLALGLTLLAGVALGGRSQASSHAGDPVPHSTVVVKPGDTLWEIAQASAPQGDVRETVEAIQQLNAMDGAGLRVGQRLAVPLP